MFSLGCRLSCLRHQKRRKRCSYKTEQLESRAMLAVFTPGNLLVSNSPFSGGEPTLYEYDTSGNKIQEFLIPRNARSEAARDIVMDPDGNVQIYNGTFSPELATFTSSAGAITQTRTFANWNTANNLTYGGIAIYDRFAFVTDTKIGGDTSEHRGLVRFNIDDGTAVRFGSPQGGMIDVAVGLDGLVYGLGPSGSPYGTHLRVYDPDTLGLLRTVVMPIQSRGIAVNAEGHLFTVDGTNGIYRFDPDGNQLKKLSGPAFAGLADMDFDQDGNLLIASHGGKVGITTEALQSITVFNTRVSNGMNFATWVTPVHALTLNIAAGSISENGGTTTATVSRNSGTNSPLTVVLSSDDVGEAIVPATITIAAGETTSPTFTVTAVDDAISDGTQSVRIAATAASHAAATQRNRST